ncbi:MAG: signal peptidase II [Elusimicrobiota bacterium]|jgi:signal peptidase II|nr:signal peptidase II [Elusimicrobiota bacterium]
MSKLKTYWPEAAITAAVFALDRISKILTLNLLAPKGSVEVLPFFRLSYVENTGAAFGIFQNGNTALAILSAAILVFLIASRKEFLKLGGPARYALIFIIAGAISNLYDRMALGFVVDYFDFIVWPVFNIADSFITTGAVILGLLVILDFFRKKGEVK